MLKNISYNEAISKVIIDNGGMATSKQIIQNISKYRQLTGLTPEATIKSELGRNRKFAKIGIDLYSLAEDAGKFKSLDKDLFLQEIEIIKEENTEINPEIKQRLHSQIQGMLLEIGNLNGFQTYTPNKNWTFNNKPLKDLASMQTLPSFTYPRVIDAVKDIDVLWFNDDEFPYPVWAWEVENSTDFRDGIIKFTELSFFKTKFNFLAPENKKNKYDKEISRPIFKTIRENCNFYSMEKVQSSYEATLKNDELKLFT
jgi:hypothetical protein